MHEFLDYPEFEIDLLIILADLEIGSEMIGF